MKFDLARTLAEIEEDEPKDAKKSEGAGKKVLTQAEIKALARARRKGGKAAAR